jgi:predicted amidohydrolase YtcJ
MSDERIRQVVGAGVAVFTALLAAAAVAASPAAQDADLILVNGHILTVDAKESVVEAVAIGGGKIVAVGSNELVRAHAAPGARIIDLKGHTATPGLIDSHAHIADGGTSMVYDVDLGDAASIAEVQQRIAARAATLKPGQWLLGFGWDEAKLAERRYIRATDLDVAAPANPVWLDHTTGHYGAANSLAIKQAGVTAATTDPTAGTIDRDAAGAPTGVFKEAAQDLITKRIPPETVEQERRGILASIDLMHREGMTAVKDPDIKPTHWAAYQSLAREGLLSAHVCVLWHTDPTLDSVRANIARLAELPKPPLPAADNLVSCGVKFYMDGSGAGRTAWMYQDWHKNVNETDVGNRGYPSIEPATYREGVRLYNEAGIHIGTHAVGDRAIDWVVDSYAAALAARPTKGLRHSIIHANLPSDHAFEVMATLQHKFDAGYPETQPPFTWWIGDNYAGNLGPDRMTRLNPYHSYLSHGIRWAAGSDFPVTPLAARYGLWASVARETKLGTFGAQPFGTGESVGIRTALRSYTIWAAHQLFLDQEAGSLEPGKSADIAVWDRDMTAVPVAALKDLQCVLTLFRGAIVYQAEKSPLGVPAAATR